MHVCVYMSMAWKDDLGPCMVMMFWMKGQVLQREQAKDPGWVWQGGEGTLDWKVTQITVASEGRESVFNEDVESGSVRLEEMEVL